MKSGIFLTFFPISLFIQYYLKCELKAALNPGFWNCVWFEILQQQNLEMLVKNSLNLEILKTNLEILPKS